MTLEDFNNIVDSYGLHKINPLSSYGFLKKYTCGDEPVVEFYEETGKLKIYIDLDASGNNMIGRLAGLRQRPHIIVS